MTASIRAATTVTTQVFRVHIKATPERIWDAITTPEWTARYGYRGPSEYDLRPGGAFRSLANEGMKAIGAPDVVVEGEVLEVDPPRRLVQTWRMLFEPSQAAGPHPHHLGDRAARPRGLQAHGHARARRRPDPPVAGHRRDAAGWRRLAVHPVRPEVSSGDGHGADVGGLIHHVERLPGLAWRP